MRRGAARLTQVVFRGEPPLPALWPVLLFLFAVQAVPSPSVLVDTYYVGPLQHALGPVPA